jgi:3-hydroxyisobutyrate dehydrogenase-like beta-hydroxyacid dehydrogenase
MASLIGFIGVGRMGANMARRLTDHGYRISAIHDRNPQAAESLARELACEAAATPVRVAELADTVMTVVSDDQAMRDIYARDASTSLLNSAKGRLFINCATLTPSVHREIEQAVERHEGASLEACMAGSITQARQGTLYLMCAGKPPAFERAKPVLDAMSAQLRYIGPSGEAAKVKALVNMVMNCNTAALAEGLGLGEALGVDLTLLREVFSQTGAASRVLETDGEDMQQRAHDCYFSAAHAAKDSGIALELAKSVGLKLPLTEATTEQYKRLVAAGGGDLDKSGIAELTFRGRMK